MISLVMVTIMAKPGAEDDFLSRERAALGDDAAKFASAGDILAISQVLLRQRNESDTFSVPR